MIRDEHKPSGISGFQLYFCAKTICPPPSLIQRRDETKVAAKRGVAISEFPLKTEPCCCALHQLLNESAGDVRRYLQLSMYQGACVQHWLGSMQSR